MKLSLPARRLTIAVLSNLAGSPVHFIVPVV